MGTAIGRVILRDFLVGAVEKREGLEETSLVDFDEGSERRVEFGHVFWTRQNLDHEVQRVGLFTQRVTISWLARKFLLEFFSLPRQAVAAVKSAMPPATDHLSESTHRS